MSRPPIPGSTGSPRPLRLFGEKVLHTPCREVTADDGSLDALVEDLFATMYAARGVGLAANQIGVPLRVFVFDCPDEEDRHRRGHLINPRLAETGGACVRGPEGCLSLPGFEAGTPRADTAVVVGEDLRGRDVRVAAEGFQARCLQHECDHLEGRVCTDLLRGVSRLRARRARRRLVARATASGG
jgi:peptide deformylase